MVRNTGSDHTRRAHPYKRSVTVAHQRIVDSNDTPRKRGIGGFHWLAYKGIAEAAVKNSKLEGYGHWHSGNLAVVGRGREGEVGKVVVQGTVQDLSGCQRLKEWMDKESKDPYYLIANKVNVEEFDWGVKVDGSKIRLEMPGTEKRFLPTWFLVEVDPKYRTKKGTRIVVRPKLSENDGSWVGVGGKLVGGTNWTTLDEFRTKILNPKKSSPRKVQSSSQSSSSSTIANTSAGDSTSGTSVDADIQVDQVASYSPLAPFRSSSSTIGNSSVGDSTSATRAGDILVNDVSTPLSSTFGDAVGLSFLGPPSPRSNASFCTPTAAQGLNQFAPSPNETLVGPPLTAESFFGLESTPSASTFSQGDNPDNEFLNDIAQWFNFAYDCGLGGI